jgi:DNA-binding transcriptional ArsR family regulator
VETDRNNENETMSVTPTSRNRSAGRTTEADADADADAERDPIAVLELLDAEYTRSILEAIRRESKPARALGEQCGASRPTVYRRLNRLRDAGLVETDMVYDSDGHHRTVFEATFESVSVDVTDDGLSVSVTMNGAETSRSPARSVSSD